VTNELKISYKSEGPIKLLFRSTTSLDSTLGIILTHLHIIQKENEVLKKKIDKIDKLSINRIKID